MPMHNGARGDHVRLRTDVRRVLLLVNIGLIALLAFSALERHSRSDVILRDRAREFRRLPGQTPVPAPRRVPQFDPEHRHAPELRRLLPDDPASRISNSTRR
jgi:hypothetical protein